MPVPSTSENFGDLLDPRFQDIFNNELDQLDDMLPTLYNIPTHNGRNDIRYSGVGAFAPFTQFTGSVNYDDIAQGYDVTGTYIEFASGFQIQHLSPTFRRGQETGFSGQKSETRNQRHGLLTSES